MAEVLSNGTGEFDSERLLEELPSQLHLPERRVKAAIEAQAGDRKRNVLVQAVSLLRQRKLDDVVKSLNNLLACNKVRRACSRCYVHEVCFYINLLDCAVPARCPIHKMGSAPRSLLIGFTAFPLMCGCQKVLNAWHGDGTMCINNLL